MKYRQVEILTTIQGLDVVTTALLEIGITDTIVEDPRDIDDLLKKEKGYEWDYIDDEVMEQKNRDPKIIAVFEDDEDGERKTQGISAAMETLKTNAEAGMYGDDFNLGSLDIKVEIDDDSRWKDNWKEFFKPTRISDTIVVKPTWEEYSPADGEKILEIDPGMAFGTGTHETTSLCVKLMEKYLKEGDKVLDVGCGSGILSIAGALMGASDVLGIEIDPVAVDVAKDNIKLNNVEQIARVKQGDLTKGIDYKADVVVANLMADLVIMLSGDVARHMLDGGKYISSGILIEKEEQVAEAIKKCGFEILEIMEDGMWCAIVGQRPE